MAIECTKLGMAGSPRCQTRMDKEHVQRGEADIPGQDAEHFIQFGEF
jgi:hypothetical protein